MQIWSFLFLIMFSLPLFSQEIAGTVTDEDRNVLPAVLVMNMRTEQRTYTNLKGEFSLAASENDELRFVRNGMDRASHRISGADFQRALSVVMIRTAADIEEVKVPPLRLSGDIGKDSRLLTKEDKVEKLQNEIGLPKAPEKPREKPAAVAKDILLPVAFGQLNVQAVYDVVSGKARRQKSLYRYEDIQDQISWIRQRTDDEYFAKSGIPVNLINEYLRFSFGKNPEIRKYVAAGNLSKVLLLLEDTLPEYPGRIKVND